MRLVVRENWLAFTEPLEGGPSAPVIYQDIRGKVTGPYGILCDTPSEVAALPMDHPDGRPATPAEKVAAYHAVKNSPDAARLGWRFAAKLSPLRFSLASMHAMALAKFDVNDRILSARLRGHWEDLPANAQMALHSLAWACGANAHFPRLFDAVRAGDYELAAGEIHMNERTPEGLYNGGLVPRNRANKILMRNAGRVRDFHLDVDSLNWSSLLSVSDADTQPDLSTVLDSDPPSQPNAASQPTVHPMPDTLDAYRSMRGEPPDDEAA